MISKERIAGKVTGANLAILRSDEYIPPTSPGIINLITGACIQCNFCSAACLCSGKCNTLHTGAGLPTCAWGLLNLENKTADIKINMLKDADAFMQIAVVKFKHPTDVKQITHKHRSGDLRQKKKRNFCIFNQQRHRADSLQTTTTCPCFNVAGQ